MCTHVLEQLGWMLSGKLAFLKRFLPTPIPLLLGVVGVVILLSTTLTGVSGWLSSSRLLLFMLLDALDTSAESDGSFVDMVLEVGPFVAASLAADGDVFSLIGRVGQGRGVEDLPDRTLQNSNIPTLAKARHL